MAATALPDPELGADTGRTRPLPVRLVRAVVAPGRLFASPAGEPRWGGALVLGAVLAGLGGGLIPPEALEESLRRGLLETGAGGGSGELTGIEGVAGIQRVMGPAAAAGGSALWTFLLAGIVTGIFAFLLGDRGRSRSSLAVTAHALLIPALGGLLLVPLRTHLRDPSAGLSLGTFAFGVHGGYLSSLLGALDLFAIGGYVVLALGVHAVDPRRSPGAAAGILLGLLVLLSAVVVTVVPG